MEVPGKDPGRSFQPVYILASSQAGQLVSGISTLERIATKYGFLSFMSSFLIPLLVFPEVTEWARCKTIGHLITIQKKSLAASLISFLLEIKSDGLLSSDALGQFMCGHQKTHNSC